MNARGIRLLLASPLLTADDDGFELITEHSEQIARWFEQHCGWPLHVERDYVLLRKSTRPDATRPARTSSGAPFDRRRYELLCLCLAELETVPVTTAALLRERVAEDLDDVLEFLERLGVLRPFEGKYRVDRTLIGRLARPSTVDKPLHRLIDDPVVYKADLTPEQKDELRKAQEVVEEAGFIFEERAEGFLLVDPEGLATDTKFPDDGNAETVALTLLNRLPATTEELEAETRDLIIRYRAYRSADPEQLTREALDVLEAFGLAENNRPLPAAARYRP